MHVDVQGARAYVYTGGRAVDPALPCVLFVHGGGQDHSAWALQSRYFAYHGRNAIVPDLPGHGRSRSTALGSISALAAWAAELLSALAIRRAAVIGHSMGALIALELAARNSAVVSALALLGAAAPMPAAESLLSAARGDEHSALDMINSWSHSASARIGGNPTPGLWMPGMSLRLMERQARGVLYADFKACNDYQQGVEAAAHVQCPVLMIAGGRDQMTPPRATRELAQCMPRARVIMLPGSGHALMAEQPDAVLDALIEFLRQ